MAPQRAFQLDTDRLRVRMLARGEVAKFKFWLGFEPTGVGEYGEVEGLLDLDNLPN